MDLPKCKICGERHRLGPCDGKTMPRVRKDTPAEAQKQAKEREAADGKKGTPFDRKAYQREYMRGYRARVKAK